MSETVQSGRISKSRRRTAKKTNNNNNQRLPALPADAQVTKRPLLHPAIPSPYSGPTHQKVIYISAKTPFLSAVKRAEKLLRLSDKRLVQSATQLNKDAQSKKKRWDREDDEIVGIAREVESAKKKGGEQREEVVLKGAGKAIGKVMELGLWFQQREEYRVRIETGSVGAVDDVEYQEREKKEEVKAGGGGDGVEDMDVDATKDKAATKLGSKIVKHEEHKTEDGKTEVNQTRIRQLSVLEVYVSLR
ncbi:Putative ribonuclease P/MRP protein subunit Rpp20/Pop7 [Septoria linicola]|uniref:Ribonuclease P/MRP protein subunit Rpp20/Pop7 n=1 Tax=Septoria linicola TaxID=215465 RepID=A0A9Q9APD7_9PEZI|nr:putative ribonuclease P/MRP protein subunit Rpp20/Pop7 [Septoria linicola]USW50693.1 Putative ribonuclease P/MRP protein subunit Rpp20/Pop7 [Septoria linicola]